MGENSFRRTQSCNNFQEKSDKEDSPILKNTKPSYDSLTKSCSFVKDRKKSSTLNNSSRKPFHLNRHRRQHDRVRVDSALYSRYRYYTRLRSSVEISDDALTIPDHIVPVDLLIPHIPGHEKDSSGKNDSFITVIAIWNTMMGTSLLTMPWAFGKAGLIGGMMLVVGIAGICFYTARRIITFQKMMEIDGEVHEITYLCRRLWSGRTGKIVEGLSMIISIVTILGALAAYWVLMSNFLYNTGEAIKKAISNEETFHIEGDLLCPANISINDTNITATIDEGFNITTLSHDPINKWWQIDLSVPLYLAIPFAFLLSITNTKVFTYFNSLGIISVFAVISFVVYKGIKWGFNYTFTDPTSPLYVPFFQNTILILSGILSMAYFVHNCIISLMKNNKNPENNVRDLSIAYVLVMMTYLPIGLIFYMAFPLPKYCLVDNFLSNFPPNNLILVIVRVFLLFQLITVFPLVTYVVRMNISMYLVGTPEQSFFMTTVYNVSIVGLCIILAIFYPRLGSIVRWVGALTGLLYIFVLPCIFYMQLMYNKSRLSIFSIIIHLLIILIGFGNFLGQFFI